MECINVVQALSYDPAQSIQSVHKQVSYYIAKVAVNAAEIFADY